MRSNDFLTRLSGCAEICYEIKASPQEHKFWYFRYLVLAVHGVDVDQHGKKPDTRAIEPLSRHNRHKITLQIGSIHTPPPKAVLQT